MDKPSDFDSVHRDAPAGILADDRVLFGAAWSGRSAIWDPVTGDWSEAGLTFGAASAPTKTGNGDEETWTLLPDGSVPSVNIDQGSPAVTAVPGSENYLLSSDTWVTAGNTLRICLFATATPIPQPG